jgi:FAD:protein FMN transferase
MSQSCATVEQTIRAGPARSHRRYECRIFSCSVVLATTDRPETPFGEVHRLLSDYERRFSRFLPDNELAALNTAEGRWLPISRQMERLLSHGLWVAVASHGLVNIATTRCLERAGYVRSWPTPWRAHPAEQAAAPVPALTEILEVRPGRARLATGYAVDFGGLAKGLWADDVLDLLGADAAASLGGDVAARGPGPDGTGWPIGLPGGRTVVLRDGGVATSGTTKRASGAAHHIIDPRTGRPAGTGLREVTVLAHRAAIAEWVATALLVGGLDAAGLTQRRDVHRCFAIPDNAPPPTGGPHV